MMYYQGFFRGNENNLDLVLSTIETKTKVKIESEYTSYIGNTVMTSIN